MNYNWLSYEEIKKHRYPNLLAELKESGYSICTVGDHLGMGRRQEDDPEVWEKLTGEEFTAGEAFALAKLFGVKLEYLISEELSMLDNKPAAKIRWAEWNERKASMIKVQQLKRELEQGLRELDAEAIRRVSRVWTDKMKKRGHPRQSDCILQ